MFLIICDDIDHVVFRQAPAFNTDLQTAFVECRFVNNIGGAGSAQMQAGYVLQPKVDPQE
jgi:hypothetical protein